MAGIARDAGDRAIREFLEATTSEDALRVRQAAEKAWLSVNEAVDGFLERRGRPVLRGQRDAHVMRKRSLEDPGFGNLADVLAVCADRLHGDCFYDGDCGPWVEGLIDRARGFVERVNALE